MTRNDTNKIGVLTPRTGAISFAGTHVVRSARHALERASEGNGGAFDLVFFDTEGSPDVAEGLLEDVDPSEFALLTGIISSEVGLVVREFTEANRIPTLGTIVGTSEYTAPGTEYNFRYSLGIDQIAEVYRRYLVEQGAETVAFIGADHAAPRNVAHHLHESELTVVSETFAPMAETDFDEAVAAIPDGTDAILFIHPADQMTDLVGAVKSRFDPDDTVLLGNATVQSSEVVAEVGRDMAGVASWGPDYESARFQDFATSLEATGVSDVDLFDCVGYDNLRIAIEALSNAGGDDPDDVTRYLREDLDYVGACGWPAAFGEGGRNDAAGGFIARWTDDGGTLRPSIEFRSERL